MMDLAVDFDTRVITTHIGRVPEDENSEEYYNIVNALKNLYYQYFQLQ